MALGCYAAGRVSSIEFEDTSLALATNSDGVRPQAQFAMRTDAGRIRAHNEDSYAADEEAGLWVVCDGMGGAAAGEVASALSAQVFLDNARQAAVNESAERRLRDAVHAANTAVFSEAQHPGRQGMGTTLVALHLESTGRAVWVVHVGDSRCYLLRNGQLEALTDDHSYVDEQVRMGLMTTREAERSPLRHVITRAVGSEANVEASVRRVDAAEGDCYLLCSDGVTGELDDRAIEEILLRTGKDVDGGAEALIRMANERGGRDNLTVVLVRV